MSEANSKSPGEQELWNGHQSQWMAFKYYLVCVLLIAAIGAVSFYANMSGMLGELWYYPMYLIPIILFAALIRFFVVRTTHYRLTDQRLIVERGIFTRDSEEIELYRVRDWSVIKPFWLRIAGRGHVRIVSTDATAPDLLVEGIGKPERFRELLRNHVERTRDKKRVRHLDIDGGVFE